MEAWSRENVWVWVVGVAVRSRDDTASWGMGGEGAWRKNDGLDGTPDYEGATHCLERQRHVSSTLTASTCA